MGHYSYQSSSIKFGIQGMRHTWKLQIRDFPRNKVNKNLIWFCVKVGEGVLEQKKPHELCFMR